MARYIDADELIKRIYPLGIGDGTYVVNAKAVRFAIDNTPTADVVPKSEVVNANSATTTGEWEKRTWIIFDTEKVGFHCSVCNTTWDTPTKFCPYCGSKMKGGAE